MFFQEIGGETHDRLFCAAERMPDRFRLTVRTAPPMAETHRRIWMDECRENPLDRPAAKHPAQQPSPAPPLAEHIAVSDENPFPGQRENFVIGSVQYHPALGLQVVERPEVVVTGKKMDGDPSVGQFRQFSQQPREPFRHDAPILVPEIENIAHQKNRLGIRRHFVEPADEQPLARGVRLPHLEAQMDIRCEIVHYLTSSATLFFS